MAKTMLAVTLLLGAGACSSPAQRTTPPTTTPHPGEDLPTAATEATSTTLPEPETTTTSDAPQPVEEAPVTTTAPRARSAPTTVPYEPPSPQSQTTRQDGGSAPLACIRSYEGDYDTDTGNGFYGAYQFDWGTWQSVGGSGNPADATPSEQDARAQMLYDRRGLAPWPTARRMC